MKVMQFLIIVWVVVAQGLRINTNRDFIGYELDENYFNVAKERIEGVIKNGTNCKI